MPAPASQNNYEQTDRNIAYVGIAGTLAALGASIELAQNPVVLGSAALAGSLALRGALTRQAFKMAASNTTKQALGWRARMQLYMATTMVFVGADAWIFDKHLPEVTAAHLVDRLAGAIPVTLGLVGFAALSCIAAGYPGSGFDRLKNIGRTLIGKPPKYTP